MTLLIFDECDADEAGAMPNLFAFSNRAKIVEGEIELVTQYITQSADVQPGALIGQVQNIAMKQPGFPYWQDAS